MDFFQYQAQAKRNTLWLYVLFAVALLAIVVAVYASISATLYILPAFWRDFQAPAHFWQWKLFAYVSATTLFIILAGSWYKIHQLKKGGGIAIAEMLGGKRLKRSQDPQERQLRNVVEEMAVASGVPTPAIFILEQQGINAFAAGYLYQDTAIAVTRGAMDMLSRDELQGVIAHEFSHLLHGDTQLKMKMMGLLHGITMISDLGIVLIAGRNTISLSGRSRGSHPLLMFSGALIFMVGLIGMLAADMIKAAMSRQREYLADASAVQFTRNPDGIGGALKVMGGYKAGSRLRLPDMQQVSHLFFGDALQSWWQSNWWATHPPLESRIKRIDPRFRGQIPKLEESAVRARNREQAAMMFAAPPNPEQLQLHIEDVMASIGEPTAEHLQQAQYVLAAIPERIRERLDEELVAKAVGYLLLLDDDRDVQRIQLQGIAEIDGSAVLREVVRLQGLIPKVDVALRLPLFDMVLPHVQQWDKAQQQIYLKTLKHLIEANKKLSLFEYLMYQSVLQYFMQTDEPISNKHISLDRLRDEVALLLVRVCSVGQHQQGKRVLQDAFAELFPGYPIKNLVQPSLKAVVHALKKLNTCSPEDKKRLLHAVVYCVLSDGVVNPEEVETMRLIAMMLECPMPVLSLSTEHTAKN